MSLDLIRGTARIAPDLLIRITDLHPLIDAPCTRRFVASESTRNEAANDRGFETLLPSLLDLLFPPNRGDPSNLSRREFEKFSRRNVQPVADFLIRFPVPAASGAAGVGTFFPFSFGNASASAWAH